MTRKGTKNTMVNIEANRKNIDMFINLSRDENGIIDAEKLKLLIEENINRNQIAKALIRHDYKNNKFKSRTAAAIKYKVSENVVRGAIKTREKCCAINFKFSC